MKFDPHQDVRAEEFQEIIRLALDIIAIRATTEYIKALKTRNLELGKYAKPRPVAEWFQLVEEELSSAVKETIDRVNGR